MFTNFSKGTFVVTLLVAIVIAGLIFNNYTKKKYGETIYGKKINSSTTV